MPFTNFVIQPPIIAHRGASMNAPENTLSAFIKAKELGLRWFEFDVTLSSDNEVIVIHDDTLERTTNGKGHVYDHPYSYLKTLDAGSWFHADFSHEKIPLFRDVIKLLNQYDMAANVEIKTLPGKEELLANKVLEIIHEDWQSNMTPPLISSFSMKTLHAVRRYDPKCWIGMLMHEWRADWEKICDELQAVSVDTNQNIIDEKKIFEVKKTRRAVLVYTVNSITRAQELFSWGIDAIFSDCPSEIMSGLVQLK